MVAEGDAATFDTDGFRQTLADELEGIAIQDIQANVSNVVSEPDRRRLTGNQINIDVSIVAQTLVAGEAAVSTIESFRGNPAREAP